MGKTADCLLLSCLFIALIVPSSLFATSRGIDVKVKTSEGQSIDLYKDYHALVVGISDYDTWPDLPNAVKDAKGVGKVLERMGFQVKVVTNPDSIELKKALNELTYKRGQEANRALLFYFAGHGETENLADGTKMGYIIPRDCPLLKEDPGGFVSKAVSMKDIEAYSLRIRSKHVLMLFDSCFSGSLFSLVRAVPEGITEKSSLPVRQFITAGTEDEAVPDRSMFKRCLLLGLEGDADLTRDGYITGTELGLYLSDKVVESTRRAQHPQYGKIRTPELSRGDFVFQLVASSSATVERPSVMVARTTLSVEANVTGARILLDGQEMGETPVSDVAVSPGEYMIRVDQEGYEPYRKKIRFDRGHSISLYVDLSREGPRKSRLFVDTEPANARVRILNIKPRFRQGMELEPGRYHVEISAEDYEAKQMWVTLAAGEDKSLNIQLEWVSDALKKHATRYVTDSFKIPLRTGPSTQKKVIALLISGERLEVLESSEDWTKVRRTSGQEGWVRTRYVIEIPADERTKFGYVIDNFKVILRAGPESAQRVISLLITGEKLEVLESSEDWTKVRRTSGQEGWVLTRYVIERPTDRWCVEGDCTNGVGTFVSLNGSRYTGEFKNGMKHGNGTTIWKIGTKYVGEFRNGKMHGKGILTYANGKTERVIYQEGYPLTKMKKQDDTN